jgi:hypothetical protein
MPEDYLTTIRSMIQHEDDLRDQRLGWLFALDGLLFAAIGFAWSDKGGASNAFIVILAAVGALVSLTSAAGQVVSKEAIDRLRGLGEHHATRDSPPVVGIKSADLTEGLARYAKSFYPWTWAPVLVFLAWIGVAITAFFR